MYGEPNVENITQSLKGLSLLLRNNKLFEDALRVFLFPYLFFQWCLIGQMRDQAVDKH